MPSTFYFLLKYTLWGSQEAFKVILLNEYLIRKYKLDEGGKSRRKTKDKNKAGVTLLLDSPHLE